MKLSAIKIKFYEFKFNYFCFTYKQKKSCLKELEIHHFAEVFEVDKSLKEIWIEYRWIISAVTMLLTIIYLFKRLL